MCRYASFFTFFCEDKVICCIHYGGDTKYAKGHPAFKCPLVSVFFCSPSTILANANLPKHHSVTSIKGTSALKGWEFECDDGLVFGHNDFLVWHWGCKMNLIKYTYI
mmetsp:Transcript_23052/g.41521  ORF Transcript_23052/g.41521 Transcript_23052/m.41521 type:complete len:107 (-) Transcript_23052:95-415(-)